MIAFGQEVETYTLDVLLGLELLFRVYFLTLDLELHQAEVLQAHLVALAKMTVDDIGES